MLQSSVFDGLAFDPFTLKDGLSAAEVDVSGREIAQAFVVAAMIIMLDEAADVGFEIAGQVVVFEQDAVLQRLMPTFDLALGLRMVGAPRTCFMPLFRATLPGRRRYNSIRCR